jgi:hypothetical protein
MKNVPPFFRKFCRRLKSFSVEVLRILGRRFLRVGAPAGTFSIYNSPFVVSVVIEGQASIPATPGSLRDMCRFEQDKQQPWPIFWVHIPNARLVGLGLSVLNEDKRMMIENLYGEKQYKTEPDYNYFNIPRSVHLEGNWTSILGRWCRSGQSTFAHWMLDGLPRLGLLDCFPADTRILIPDPLFRAQKESLEILGIIDRCRPTTERHVTLDNYYFSSFTARQGCDDFYAIKFMRDRFLGAGVPVASTGEKIYIARKGAARTPLQEEQMIEFLQGEGWTILEADRYSLREQIGIFRKARAVCSIHGAGLVNLLWCEKGCKVLELCASNYLNGSLESLALCLGHDHHFMVFDADKTFRMSVDMKKFKAAILALGGPA